MKQNIFWRDPRVSFFATNLSYQHCESAW